MKKFSKLFKIGTKVTLESGEIDIVKNIHETRKWIKCEKHAGSFQRQHIVKFSNKQG